MKILDKITTIKWVGYLIEKLKYLSFPGLIGVPIYFVVVSYLKNLMNSNLTMRASAIAFNLFLAVFPSIIFLFTLIAYVPIDNLQDRLLGMLQEVLPSTAFEAARSTIIDIIARQRGNLLSFGFFAALIFSSNGMVELIQSFNSLDVSKARHSFLKERLLALLITIVFALTLILAIALIVLSEYLVYLVKDVMFVESIEYYLILLGRWAVLISIVYFSISFVYNVSRVSNKKWRLITPGATLSTILFLLTTFGFKFYVANFSTYNTLYGSIGALIVVLLWFYINALILLLGFELNVSILLARKDNG